MLKKLFALLLLLFWKSGFANPINIVAAENFYGNIAQQIGGPYVQVVSILNNPNQDPHLFSSTIKTAKAIADADVIIYNGINYDPWMENLILNNHKPNKIVINVANLINKKPGDNPHIWYDPNTMPVYAKTLTQRLSSLDSAHQNYYQQQLALFNQNYQTLLTQIQQLKTRYQNISIIATEPVFNYMADAIGLNMYGKQFQLSVMNDTEPSAQDTKNFEDKLRQHQVKVLIYNNQVINPITMRMQGVAKQSGVPVVGVSETQPVSSVDYISWMRGQLQNLDNALSNKQG